MAHWRLTFGEHVQPDGTTGVPQWELPDPQNLRFTFDLHDPHDVTCDVDGLAAASQYLAELEDDVWAYRDNELMFRGPLLSAADTADGSTYRVTIDAQSYKARLARWFTRPGNPSNPLYPVPLQGGGLQNGVPDDPANIAWRQILTYTGPTGSSEIRYFTKQVNGTQASRNVAAGPGLDLKTVIDAIGQINPGFAWDMLPVPGGIQFTTWSPTRGTLRDDLLDYGGSIVAFTRSIDFGQFCTDYMVTGTDSTNTAVYSESASNQGGSGLGGWGPAGQWMSMQAGQVLDAAQLQDRANWLLGVGQVVRPVYTFTLAPGWWNPDRLWLDDSIPVVIKSGRLNVDTVYRIEHVDVTVADGTETVQVSTGTPPNRDIPRRLRNIGGRLRALETQI